MEKSGIKGGNKVRRESGMATKVRQIKWDGGKINKYKSWTGESGNKSQTEKVGR
jgi:hypothetical protein